MGSDNDTSLLKEVTELRLHAEERLCEKTTGLKPPRINQETRKLVHELEVHKIELEMQNSELLRARDEVDTALELYADLYNFAPIGYLTLNRTGDINAVNLAGAKLLDTVSAGLIGRRFMLYISLNDRPLFADFLEKVFASQGKESSELTLTRKDNHLCIVQIDAVASASGKECRLALIDITGRRRAEDTLAAQRLELEDINRTLELRIAKAVEEVRLKDQLLILQDRHATMGEMIGNIAHQWRQPLNTLGLFTQRLGFFYGSPRFNKEFLDTSIAKSMEIIQYMSRTIDDFRYFFSTEREKSEFSINEAFKMALSLVEASFKERGINIDREESGEVVVYGYSNEYAQVLLNILINARDAMNERTSESPCLKIYIGTEHGVSVLTISDNGGGIAENIIGKIFDPYFTTKGPQMGTGIGLFMSKTIIENNMGGRLTVRNTEVGAEFRIEV